jgi:hypothetical protein
MNKVVWQKNKKSMQGRVLLAITKDLTAMFQKDFSIKENQKRIKYDIEKDYKKKILVLTFKEV